MSSTNLHLPFNLFAWSMAIFLLYVFVQFIVTVAYASVGQALTPWLGLFTWFAVSAAIGYSLETRYKPKAVHMWLLQGMACFYMVLVSAAIMLRGTAAIDFESIVKVLIVVGSLYAAGVLAFTSVAVWRRHKFSSLA